MRRWPLVAACLLVAACSVTSEPTDWALTAEDGTELTLVVLIGSSDCQSLGGVVAAETDDAVEITATVDTRTGPFCGQDDLVIETVEVQLEAAIGERDLVGCKLGEDEYFSPAAEDPSSHRETCRELVDGW